MKLWRKPPTQRHYGHYIHYKSHQIKTCEDSIRINKKTDKEYHVIFIQQQPNFISLKNDI